MSSFVSFDACGLIVEALILVSLIVRRMTRGRLNRWALVLIVDIMVATAADMAGLILEGMGQGYIVWKYISNALTLWGTCMTSVIFCGFLFAMIGVWHKLFERKVLAYVYYVPIFVISALVFVVNPFTKIIYFINENGIYQRGPLFYSLYALAYMYIVVGYFEMIRYRRLFTKLKFLSVFMVFFIMVSASIFQAIHPQYNIQMFFTSVAFLMVLFGLQSPEERMHGSTGLFSMSAYIQDINKYHQLNAPIGVTLSVMKNYGSLIEMLGYFTVQDIILTLAKRLEKTVSEIRADIDLYYLGGGRFAAITDDRYEDEKIRISQEINAALSREVDVNGMAVKVMNNVCFIAAPGDIDDPKFLFSFDGRLEMEAYTGELRYAERLFDKKRFELRHDIAKVIDRAFDDNLFYLEYQPVYSAADKRFVRAEAFLRLNDPNFGDIRPDLLISEAERLNSIHAITAYVIEEVCSFVSMPDFLLLGLDFIEINLSPVQCMWSDLLTVLLSTMKSYNVQPKNICFNITDVDGKELFDRMRDNIDALSQVGFQIFMDDFGAGIFEVERIAQMPLSGIKLDRNFVREGLKGENTAVFEGSLRMITDLEIDPVAVGVENKEMEERLTALGCNYLQGYNYCKPMDKKELIRFILMR